MKLLRPGDDCGFVGRFSTGLFNETPEVLISDTRVGEFLYNSLKAENIDIDELSKHNVTMQILVTIHSMDGVTATKRQTVVQRKSWFEENYGWLYETPEPKKPWYRRLFA